MAAGGEFEWRPGAPRRKLSALWAVPVLAACAAAGAGLSWFLPIEKLIVAIERNGETIINPGPDEEIHTNDQLLLLAKASQLEAARRELAPVASA